MKKEIKKLYVGRIDYDHKRVDRLIDIWSKISGDFPTWSIDFVGDGPIKQELVDLVKVKKIERVNFINFTDPIKYYMSSSIVCMTSTFEGLPMVLIEASKFGCIPVAFNSFASLSDIIADGKDGYMIKSFSLSKYENTLRLLMKDTKLRETIQMDTIKIPGKFQPQIIIKQWIKLFDELFE